MVRQLRELSTVALRAGQSAEEFWHGDPSWTWTYIRNWESDQRALWKKKDMEQWQLGIYILKAVATCLSKEETYPEKPLFYEPSEEEKFAEHKQELDRIFGVVRE